MPGLNKRSVLNMNLMSLGRDYPFINLLKTAYAQHPASLNLSLVDAQGYRTDTTTDRFYWIADIPGSSNTTGPYVLTWTGNGTLWMDDGSTTWSEQAGSINYTRLSNGRWSGTNAYIVLTTPNFAGVENQSMVVEIRSTNSSNRVRDVKFYMLADEADLTAGKVFRRGWKQTILDHNPGCIRAMNWSGGSSNPIVRWRNYRIPPDYNNYINYFNTIPYGTSTGTNDVSIGSATGMPVAVQHGEVVQFIVGNTTSDRFGITRHISGITNNSNGRVNCVGHGFATGQKVIHFINNGASGTMHQMHYKVATVTNIDADHYDLNINTTSFAAFVDLVSGVGNLNFAMAHVTLEVGPGRGRYPVFEFQGTPINLWNNQWTAGGMTIAIFDKYLVCDRDIGPGAWLSYRIQVDASNAWQNLQPGVPIEICVALVNELNAMKQIAHPGSGAINLWITAPYAGLMSVDPDYDALDNWPVNAVALALNGDGGSWPGLTSAAALLVEYSNETWNDAGGYFYAALYLARIAQLRYAAGHTWPNDSYASYNEFSTVRAMQMHQELATAFPTQLASGRLIRVMGGHAGGGTTVSGTGGTNDIRVNGSANTAADAWNVGGTAPYTKFEAFAWAPYFDVANNDYITDLPTHTANWLAAVGAPAKEAVCASWVARVDQLGSDYGRIYETTVMLPTCAAWMVARGKTVIQYEGGYNWATITGAGIPGGNLTANQAAFLTAVQNSAAWAASQTACFNAVAATAGAYHPSIFIQITNNRWGYNRPNVDAWLGGVEGAGLNQTWTAIGAYNNAQDTGGSPAITAGLPLMLALRTRIMPKYTAPVVGPVWTTLYEQVLTSGAAGFSGATFRCVVPVAAYGGSVPSTGSSLRVTIQSHASISGASWDHIYIGHAAVSGDAYDLDGTQVLLLWSGIPGGSIAVNTSLVSDSVVYAFDKTRPLVISAHFNATTALKADGVTGFTRTYKLSVDEASTSNVSSYTVDADNLTGFPKIEVFS